MLSNKKNFSSASNIFFQSRHTSLPAWSQNAQHAAEKLAELNTVAALALVAESRETMRLCQLADSPQALLALAFTQAQANIAKAQSYTRHWSAIIFSIGGDEFAEMRIASRKLSLLLQKAEKKLHAVASPALTLLDCAYMAPGSAVLRLKLATFDVTDVTDFTETGAPIAGSGDGAPGPRQA